MHSSVNTYIPALPSIHERMNVESERHIHVGIFI